jgi:hypothetical protein
MLVLSYLLMGEHSQPMFGSCSERMAILCWQDHAASAVDVRGFGITLFLSMPFRPFRGGQLMAQFARFMLVFPVVFSALCISQPSAAQTPPAQLRDGTYLVNQQIAPGTYRSGGKSTACYWERAGEGSDILDNHYGLAGGVVTVQPSDYKFMSRGCGPWTALDPNNKPALPMAQQIAPKKDGFYVIGVDIAPGVWRSTGPGAQCYWERTNITQDILDNDLDFAGGAVTIRPDDFEFYARGCGIWTMLDTNNLPALPADKQRAAKKDGVYIIGLNMAPGRWRSNGLGKSCYWEKSTVTQEIIDNHLGVASVIVEIAPSDFEFKAHGCGVWMLSEGVGAPADTTGGNASPPPAKGAACPSSNVCISAPASGLRVPRGSVVAFTGTATHPAFTRYQFLAGKGTNWGHIADFQKPVVNGVLMELHTDTLPTGTYTIRLQVIDNTGNASPEKADMVLIIQ